MKKMIIHLLSLLSLINILLANNSKLKPTESDEVTKGINQFQDIIKLIFEVESLCAHYSTLLNP